MPIIELPIKGSSYHPATVSVRFFPDRAMGKVISSPMFAPNIEAREGDAQTVPGGISSGGGA